MTPPSNRVTGHRRLNSSSNQDMDSMRGFGDSAHYGNMRSKFAYGGFMEGKEALQYRDMDSMRGFGVSAHYGNEEFDMRSKFACTGFVKGKKALKYRVESTRCFGGFAQGKEASECMGSLSHVGKWKRLHPKRVIILSSLKDKYIESSHKTLGGEKRELDTSTNTLHGRLLVSEYYGNEEFDMGSKYAVGGLAQGKEASEYKGSAHMGEGEQLHPKCLITWSVVKDKIIESSHKSLGGENQLPKWVKVRGPYRALTFQEKEYYCKRAEESRGFDVPDIPDDIDPFEIEVKPFKLDQHPPGSELWKEVEKLADYSKLALDKYNKCNAAAKYQFAKLIKANCRGGYPIEYFITFQAYDMACFRCKTFQANVTIGFKETTADCWPEPYPTSRRSSHNIDGGPVECSSADQRSFFEQCGSLPNEPSLEALFSTILAHHS